MIKNQLYPYIEKYINEYLYGFSKEQLDVGVMNGIINIDKVNIRVDKANEKLDSKNIPIWLKAGLISKIKIGCSLMNFIGEKPLEVEIDEIEILVSPSCRWIMANFNSFIEENEEYIHEAYDPNDNNSYDIFTKKLSLFDGSVFKKKAELLEFLKDKSKVTEMIHKMMTKVMKFYYLTNFFINAKINKVHIRFEDDIFNFFGGTIIGVKVDSVEVSLSAEGKLKKDSIKVNNLNVYTEDVGSLDNFFVTSTYFLTQLNKEGFGKEYYDSIDQIYKNIKNKKSKDNRISFIKDFNFLIRFGIQNADSNINIFTSAKDKSLKAYFFIATSDLNVSINPNFIGKATSLKDFFKCYYLNEQIQQYKPMRKPYNVTSDVVKSVLANPNPKFEMKRKLIVRDWIYYFIMFSKFKKAMYSKPFSNKLQEEFSKYFNICCSENLFPEVEAEEKDEAQDKDDKSVAASKLSKGNLTTISKITNNKPKDKSEAKKGINPDNVSLTFSLDLSIKSIKLEIYESFSAFIKMKDFLLATFDQVKAKINSNMKDDFNVELAVEKLSLNSYINGEKSSLVIPTSLENNIIGNKTRNVKESIVGKQADAASVFDLDTDTKDVARRTLLDMNVIKFKQLNEAINKFSGKEERADTKRNPLLFNFMEDDNEIYDIEETHQDKKITLLAKIKEHNQKKIKVTKINTLQKAPTITESISINLDFIELKGLKFNFNKENADNNQVNDRYSAIFDNIRFNLTSSPLKVLIKVFSGYEVLLRKILYNKNSYQQYEEKVDELKRFEFLFETPKDRIVRSTFDLQNIIISKIKNKYEISSLLPEESSHKLVIKSKLSTNTPVNTKSQPNEFIKNYYSHLQTEINSYDKLLLKEGKYQLNYFFYILHKKRVDITLMLKSFYITAFGEDKKSHKLLGKLTVPHNQLKFKISPQKVHLSLNETEFEYYDVEAWRSVADYTINLLQDKINIFRTETIKPFIDIYYKEESFKGKNVEMMQPKLISGKSKLKLVDNEEVDINILSRANV